MTDYTDPSSVVDDLEPELAEGPLGLPYVKPKGGPDLPDGPDEIPNPLD